MGESIGRVDAWPVINQMFRTQDFKSTPKQKLGKMLGLNFVQNQLEKYTCMSFHNMWSWALALLRSGTTYIYSQEYWLHCQLWYGWPRSQLGLIWARAHTDSGNVCPDSNPRHTSTTGSAWWLMLVGMNLQQLCQGTSMPFPTLSDYTYTINLHVYKYIC